MSNESGLEPVGRAVLVTTYEPERKSGLIHIPETAQDRSRMAEQRAVVVAIGPAAWEDEKVHRAKVGDKVLITNFAGMMAKGTKDGKPYRLVNDRDIFCKIVEESQDG